MKPKVSVIIPVYNTEKYLIRCLNSVVNQTLKDVEIICVNDGSTDGSLKILMQYASKDPRIKVIDKEKGGVASARNAGLEVAKSDYIGFVDSDDWIAVETYEKTLGKMLEDSEIDFVCWGCDVTPEQEGVEYMTTKIYHTLKFSGKKELNDDICFETTVTLVDKIFKREIIQKNNIAFPDKLLFEDSFFYWSYIANCRYAYFFDEYYYNYIRRKNSIIGLSSEKKYTSHFRLLIWESIYQYYKQKGLAEKKNDLLKKIFTNYYDLEASYSPNPEQVYKSARKMAKKYKLDVKLNRLHYSLGEKIFSIKSSTDRTHKVVSVLGVKIKFKKKAK